MYWTPLPRVTVERTSQFPNAWLWISVTESGDLPFGGYGPAIIEWHEGFHPCLDLPDNNIRLKNLIIQHPAADLMSSFLGNFLNDDRIIFVQGDSKITAEIITSQGFVVLK